MTIKSIIKRNFNKQPRLDHPNYRSSIFRAPRKELFTIPSSMSELSGPIFNKEIIGNLDNDLTLNFSRSNELPIGHKIVVYGTILISI